MNKLAILGGKPLFKKSLTNLPYTNRLEKKYVNYCLRNKTFSRFVGSPVSSYRDQLGLTSKDAIEINDKWSVLGGKFVRSFEDEFAKRHNVDYAISVNSATSGITAAIIASGLKPGDEIITTPISFTATATAIHLSGAKVKFVDINPQTLCMDYNSLKKKITKNTKAVIPVHLNGSAGEITKISKLCKNNNIILIEDSAQALTCKINNKYLGTIGLAGIFSFQESKNIMTGEGGMVITNEKEIAYRLRLIRNHGESMVFKDLDDQKRIETALGYNFRLPEILAAVGYAQIKKAKIINKIRLKNYDILKLSLEKYDFINFQKITNDEDGFYPYHVGLIYDGKKLNINRDIFVKALIAEGIPLTKGFPRTLNENLFFKNEEEFPNAKKMNYETYIGLLTIGYPNGKKEMSKIISAFEKVINNKDELKKLERDSSSSSYEVFR